MLKLATVKVTCGWLAFAWSEEGLFALTLPQADASLAMDQVTASVTGPTEESFWPALERALASYFAGKPVDFTPFPVDWSGYTPFERAVLEVVRRVPFGTTLSYGRVAERAGYPRAARATGNALGKNRTPIVIPCHRVVQADGSVGGFSGGPGWKEYLLRLERSALRKLAAQSRAGCAALHQYRQEI